MESLLIKRVLIFSILMSIYIYPNEAFLKEGQILKKWGRIESLISEEIDSIQKNRPITEEKYYRILELLTEKLSILKKKENFLLIKKGQKKNKLVKGSDLYRILNKKKKLYLKVYHMGKIFLKGKRK